jgi:hypothetical protein
MQLARKPSARYFGVAVRMTLALGVTLALGATVALAAPHVDQDLGGVSSRKDLASGVVPIGAADVQFYLKVMRASLPRYGHPSAQDTADIAQAKRLRDRQMSSMQNAKSPGDIFIPSPEEQAMIERGARLGGGHQPAFEGLPEVLAMDAGMPREQWELLAQHVEDAAEIKREVMFGSGVDSPTGADTPEKAAHRAKFAARLQQEHAVASADAAEIRQMHGRAVEFESQRQQ